MAECFEDTSGQDTDRIIDGSSFRREQFDIFKHNFREAFDDHGHALLANLTLPDTLKKDVINSLRKLQKAKHTLDSLPEKSLVSELYSKIDQIRMELEKAASGNTEFSARNIDLPEYDKDAMEMLFGPPMEPDPELFQSLTLDPVKEVSNFNSAFKEKIAEILGAAQILLNDYNDFMDYVKKNAVR
uniref:Uncharacterized protein n=1 Tax=Acrobeloides nanus TaxID=290746 RepID=A0A914DWH2_9BILA